MNTRENSSQFKTFVSSMVCLLLILLIIKTAPVDVAQGRAGQSTVADRTIEVTQFLNAPVEVVEISLNGLSIKSKPETRRRGRTYEVGAIRFSAQDDWLKNLRVTLRNNSSRPVTGVSAVLLVSHPTLQTQNPYGIFLSLAAKSQRKSLREQPLSQGTEAEFEVSDGAFGGAAEYFRRNGAPVTVAKALFHIVAVSHGDNLQWRSGSYLRRDPNNSQRWEATTGAQEPNGNRSGYKPISYASPKEPAAQGCYAEIAGVIQYYCYHGEPACHFDRELGSGSGDLDYLEFQGPCESDGAPCTYGDRTWQLLFPVCG